MKFPPWVDEQSTEAACASARLRYLVNRLAIDIGPHPSMRLIAHVVGVNDCTISKYIERGSFSINMATRFETVLKKPGLADQLHQPLAIQTT